MRFKKELFLVIANGLLIGVLFWVGGALVNQLRTGSHSALSFKVDDPTHISVATAKSVNPATTDIKNGPTLPQHAIPLHEFENQVADHSLAQQQQNAPKKTTKSHEKTHSKSRSGENKKPSTKTLVGFHEVYKVPNGYCALTFDDGPTDYTKRIALLLKMNKIPATFFVIGTNVHTYPDSIRYLSQQDFDVEDHSESHPVMSKLSATAQAKQILQNKKEVEALTHKKVTLFRPPYGDFNTITKEVLAKNGMKMALWTDDPKDWDGKTPKQIIQTLSKSHLNGKVIILHEKKQTYEALPEILKLIKKQGLKVVLI